MICFELQAINFPLTALTDGARMTHDINVRPECTLSRPTLEIVHRGKEECILNLRNGKNGFPPCPFQSQQETMQFDLGCQQELKDIRQLRAWTIDYNQCFIDKSRGVL